MVFFSGLAVNAFTLFLARFGVGISKSNTGPVHGSLLADAYPIGVRGRMSAATMSVRHRRAGDSARSSSVASRPSPAASRDGDGRTSSSASRSLVLAFFAFRIPEPRRGQ